MVEHSPCKNSSSSSWYRLALESWTQENYMFLTLVTCSTIGYFEDF